MRPLEDLVAELKNPSEDARIRAVISLIRVNDGRAVNHLKRVALKDESHRVRELAQKGLAGRDLLARRAEHLGGIEAGVPFEQALNELEVSREDIYGAATMVTPPGEEQPEGKLSEENLDGEAPEDDKKVPLQDPTPGPENTRSRYVLTGKVGSGGMGAILNAFDTTIQREVAMKVITSELESSRKFIDRFIKEARVQGRLEHPNICPIHELGVDEKEHVYFTMKMVQGTSLSSMIRSSDVGGEEVLGGESTSGGEEAPDAHRQTELLNVFLKICDALSFAHSRGIIHRDIKPDNIMVGDFGEVYVMDWGLAKIIGEGESENSRAGLFIARRLGNEHGMKTMAGSVVGTPAYMPPEQARGEVDTMDQRSDIYSLGALLYELLTRRVLFTGKSPWDVLSRISREAPPLPSQQCVAGTISPELDSIVMKCLEKMKKNRYESVQDLKRDVELYLSGRPIEAMEYSLWQVAAKWVARNRVLASSVLAVLLVLLASFVVSYVRISASESEAIKQRDEARLQRTLAHHQREIAEDRHLKATANEQKALLNLALIREERREIEEAIALYDSVREEMTRTGTGVDRFIDLIKWRARYNKGSPVWEVRAIENPVEVPCRAICYTPDRQLVALCHNDRTIRLHDAVTGRLEHSFSWKGEHGLCLAVSPDSAYLACGTAGRAIRVWDLRTRRAHAVLRDPSIPDGKAHLGPVFSLDFSPDSALLASAGDVVIRLWNVRDGTYNRSLWGHLEEVNAVAFSPDGKSLVSGGREKKVWLWNVQRGQPEKILFEHRDRIKDLVFSPDGTLLVSASNDSTIKLWDTVNSRVLATLRGHQRPVKSLSFSSDGRTLVSGGEDGSVRFWDIKEQDIIAVMKDPLGPFLSVAYHPDGKTVASGGASESVRIRSLDRERLVRRLDTAGYRVFRVAFSPDGNTLAVGTRGPTIVPVILYDVRSWTAIANFQGHGGRVRGLAFSPDGSTIASVGNAGLMNVSSVEHRKHIASVNIEKQEQTDIVATLIDSAANMLESGKGDVWTTAGCVTFSPDGNTIATGSGDGTVRLWDAASLSCLHAFRDCRSDVRILSFSRDGSLLMAGGKGETFFFWDVAGRRLTNSVPNGNGTIESMSLSPDGSLMVSGNSQGNLRLWDLKTMRLIRTFTGHFGTVNSVAFHPNSRIIASGGSDATLRLWDAANGECLLVLRNHVEDVESVDFSPDGSVLSSGSKDGAVNVWSFGEALNPIEYTADR